MSIKELNIELKRSDNGLLDFALRLTRDKVDASDLYQETAYRAIKNIHQFKPNTNLRAWLRTIMRNTFINAYRKSRRVKIYQDSSDNHYLIDSTKQTVKNNGELKMNYEELISLVDRIDDYLRIPFMMSYQGFKYEEIAEELDIPIGTVKSRIFMARRRIKNSIRLHYAIRNRDELYAA